MNDDDRDIEYLEQDEKVFDEKLERIGGVFVEPEQTQVDCNAEKDACAPDDYPEDPYAIDNRPGTVDDVGYSSGLTTRDANDLSMVPDGQTRQSGPAAPATERDLASGAEDEADLWSLQEPLIEEDVDDGIKIPLGMSDEDAEDVLDAMGDDSSEVLPETAEGGSATGESTTPEHGGFPEREG